MSVALPILESVTSGVVAMDRDENIIVFNEAAAHLLGVPKEKALGRNLLSVVPNSGLVIGAVSVFQDITEMEKISRELDSTKIIVRTLEEVLAGAGEWMVVDAAGLVTVITLK